MRIIITGGTGFVGKHLREELEKRSYEFVFFSKNQVDLTNKDETFAFFEKHKDFDIIIHMASFHGGGSFPAEHPWDQFVVNNRIHLNVLHAWKELLPKAKLIAVGSSCAYPDKTPPFEEKDYMDGEIHGSVYAYAFTKRLLYTGIKALNDQFGTNGSFLIPATMYGEWDNFSEETGHVCGALIGKFVKAEKLGLEKVEVWGDGEQERDFIDVKDFVRVLAELIPKIERDVLNIAPGSPTKIRELAEIIKEASGFKGEIFYNKEKYVGVKRKFLSSKKLNEKYGMVLLNNLKESIKRTVEWYKNL